MPRPRHLTTTLPRQLREELGIQDRHSEGRRRQQHAPASQRKERRKEERMMQKRKDLRRPPTSGKHLRREESEDDDEDEEDLDDSSEEEEHDEPASKTTKKNARSAEPDDTGDRKATRKLSRTVQDRLAQDNAEITALEKRLGIKDRKKLPKAFEEEGLADILGELGDDSEEDDTKKRKRDGGEWLQRKRRKAQGLLGEESEDSEDENDLLDESDEDDFGGFDDEDSDSEDENEDGEEDEEFASFDDEDEKDESEEKPKKKVRENPYVAPVPRSPSNGSKYIPPSLRAASTADSEDQVRLRRQVQGLLNKLSEANLISILGDIEKLYRENPRQSVTSTVASLLLGLVTDRSTLQDTFIILHAGFIASIYKIIGMDFGAEIIQKLVETFDKFHNDQPTSDGKESLNLMSLLSQLYNFHVIGSNLVFEYIRLFLERITEANTELLLKIIRSSGPQLRQDDPSSLKDIVLLIQPAVSQVGESALSVRTKFMIETITDLKNNRLKTGVAASSVASEHITKMRKILGSLNNGRTIRAAEPIRISRTDIQNSAKKGKWWLVGASWKEDDPLEAARRELSTTTVSPGGAAASDEEDAEQEPDLVSLARAHRMNTDVRRAIFVAIMSASDYRDAHVRLLKLHLKRNQEYEIPRVLVHCAMEETAHNPYYTIIARRLCGEMGRRMKMSFAFTLWDVFKRMGEKPDPAEEEEEDAFDGFDDDGENQIPVKAVVNLAKMYGTLVAENSLSLSILKNLNFAYLQPRTSTFVELLILTILQRPQQARKGTTDRQTDAQDSNKINNLRDEKALSRVFGQTHSVAPQIVKGLIYFIRKVVAKSDVVTSAKERKVVKWGCGVAVDALKGGESE